jgi:hypothetical protein
MPWSELRRSYIRRSCSHSQKWLIVFSIRSSFTLNIKKVTFLKVDQVKQIYNRYIEGIFGIDFLTVDMIFLHF